MIVSLGRIDNFAVRVWQQLFTSLYAIYQGENYGIYEPNYNGQIVARFVFQLSPHPITLCLYSCRALAHLRANTTDQAARHCIGQRGQHGRTDQRCAGVTYYNLRNLQNTE